MKAKEPPRGGRDTARSSTASKSERRPSALPARGACCDPSRYDGQTRSAPGSAEHRASHATRTTAIEQTRPSRLVSLVAHLTDSCWPFEAHPPWPMSRAGHGSPELSTPGSTDESATITPSLMRSRSVRARCCDSSNVRSHPLCAMAFWIAAPNTGLWHSSSTLPNPHSCWTHPCSLRIC